MRNTYILILLFASLCAGCATKRPSLTDNPITGITVYPGDTKMTEPRVIQGQELEAILADSHHQDTLYGTWLELPIQIQQGPTSRRGCLRLTSTFIPVVVIVIPYGRFWNTDNEILMLSDIGSDRLMKMLIPADE